MSACILPFIKSKKLLVTLLTALIVLAGLTAQHAWSSNGLPRINSKTLQRIAQQHHVVVLFRHAERCDRSDNVCLSDKSGITVAGAQKARALGNAFRTDIKNADVYSSNTVRTIQSATWFAGGKKVTVDKKLMECDSGIYRAINNMLKTSENNNVVAFTHNHCLNFITKNRRGIKWQPDYLDGLVMHSENGKLILDGQFVSS